METSILYWGLYRVISEEKANKFAEARREGELSSVVKSQTATWQLRNLTFVAVQD